MYIRSNKFKTQTNYLYKRLHRTYKLNLLLLLFFIIIKYKIFKYL